MKDKIKWLAKNVMDWNEIPHLMVEAASGDCCIRGCGESWFGEFPSSCKSWNPYKNIQDAFMLLESKNFAGFFTLVRDKTVRYSSYRAVVSGSMQDEASTVISESAAAALAGAFYKAMNGPKD